MKRGENEERNWISVISRKRKGLISLSDITISKTRPRECKTFERITNGIWLRPETSLRKLDFYIGDTLVETQNDHSQQTRLSVYVPSCVEIDTQHAEGPYEALACVSRCSTPLPYREYIDRSYIKKCGKYHIQYGWLRVHVGTEFCLLRNLK